MDPAIIMGWMNDATNSGGSFQRLVEAQVRPLAGLGPFQESYRPIEGGLFQQGKRSILILQNASAEVRLYDPSQGGAKPWPVQANLLISADLVAEGRVAAPVTVLNSGQPVGLPPYSLLRLVWQ